MSGIDAACQHEWGGAGFGYLNVGELIHSVEVRSAVDLVPRVRRACIITLHPSLERPQCCAHICLLQPDLVCRAYLRACGPAANPEEFQLIF